MPIKFGWGDENVESLPQQQQWWTMNKFQSEKLIWALIGSGEQTSNINKPLKVYLTFDLKDFDPQKYIKVSDPY